MIDLNKIDTNYVFRYLRDSKITPKSCYVTVTQEHEEYPGVTISLNFNKVINKHFPIERQLDEALKEFIESSGFYDELLKQKNVLEKRVKELKAYEIKYKLDYQLKHGLENKNLADENEFERLLDD